MTAHCIGCEQQTQFRPSLLSLPSQRVKLEPKTRMLSQPLWFLKQITNNKYRLKCGQFHFIPSLFQGFYIGVQFLNSYLTQLFCKADANEDIDHWKCSRRIFSQFYTYLINFPTGSPSSKYEHRRASASGGCVTFDKDLYGEKTNRFCNRRKWKDFNKKMYVCMHVCMYVTIFSLSIRFIKVGDSSEAARRIHRRKTAINSFQRLQSAPNSA